MKSTFFIANAALVLLYSSQSTYVASNKVNNNSLMNKIVVVSKSQSIEPDVTAEFDRLLSETRKKFEDLNRKWPITVSMVLKDIDYLARQKSNWDRAVTFYYQDLDTWRQLITQLTYLKGYFKTGGIGDIKNGSFKKYGKNVIYKGKSYTVEQLGNINYGVGLKAMKIPFLAAACAAGCYQVLMEECGNLNSDNARKYLSALKKAVKNKELRGICLDYSGDTRMIRTGYNWY